MTEVLQEIPNPTPPSIEFIPGVTFYIDPNVDRTSLPDYVGEQNVSYGTIVDIYHLSTKDNSLSGFLNVVSIDFAVEIEDENILYSARPISLEADLFDFNEITQKHLAITLDYNNQLYTGDPDFDSDPSENNFSAEIYRWQKNAEGRASVLPFPLTEIPQIGITIFTSKNQLRHPYPFPEIQLPLLS